MLRTAVALILALVPAAACSKGGAAPGALVTAEGARPLTPGEDPVAEAGGRRLDALLDGRVRLVGAKLPAQVRPGETFEATLWLRVEKSVFGAPRVFVHGAVPGAEMHQAGADHDAVSGKVAPTEWKEGDVLVDTFQVRVPQGFPADRMTLLVGMYEGDKRWSVEPDSAHDGKDRVPAGSVAVVGAPSSELVAQAKKRRGPIVVDGKLDEADWQQAAKLGPFVSYDGRTPLQNRTWARIVWDEQNLYVAFEAEDKDAHTPYEKRDDPLYNSEAVEVFIDADGDKDEYVELQAAPNDLHFDAAFKGGRRKGMETGYDVEYETKTVVDGTLNDPSDEDRGFVSEWRIPVAQLRDVPAPPAVGASWKINLFRLDRIRRGGKVVKNEASAWSSPLSGDFHNLDRFGTLQLVE